jgi:hypothetical protein
MTAVLPKNYRAIALRAIDAAQFPVVLMDKRRVADFSERGPLTQRGIAACRDFEIRDGSTPILGFHDHPNEMWISKTYETVAHDCATAGWLKARKALDCNKVKREGESVVIPDKPVKNRVAALAVLLIVLVLFLFALKDIVILGKAFFVPAEAIYVTLPAITPEQIEDGALVGLFVEKGEPGKWRWRTYERAKERDEQKFFDAPKEPGEYEIQAHINNEVMDEPTLVARISIVVSARTEDAR